MNHCFILGDKKLYQPFTAIIMPVFPNNDALDGIEVSALRIKNADPLSDVNVRYRGKKLYRKKVPEYSIESGSSEDYSEDSSNQYSSEEEHSVAGEDSGKEGDSGKEYSEDENSQDDFEDENKHKLSAESDSDTDKFLKTSTSLSANIKKGLAVRNQLVKYEKLMEIRMNLQKCLVAANRFPQTDTYKEIKNQSDTIFQEQVNCTLQSLRKLLNNFLILQKLGLEKYPETKNLYKNVAQQNKSDKEESDEEILSDSENEEMPVKTDEVLCEESEYDEDDIEESPVKKRKLEEYEKDIFERFNVYKRKYRDSVIQKWYEKANVSGLSGMKSNSQDILNRIEYILSNKNKMIQRTQVKRSKYSIIGETKKEDQTQESDEKKRFEEEYNSNIYDDDDFYHQLLQELIDSKSANITDPVALSRQWVHLQRSKMKRNVDTKATKGRKIAYVVHSKLVNSMAPIVDNQSKDVLLTLFGRKPLNS